MDYFNGECGYCGMKEEDHYMSVGTAFHREHVVHDGNNFIDNCIPSCKSCNSRKHDAKFTDWYNELNPIFQKEG